MSRKHGDPRKRKVTRIVATSKKVVKHIEQKTIDAVQEKIDKLNAVANTSRVMKHKINNAEARVAKRTLRKMIIQKEKQDGNFVPQEYNTIEKMRVPDATMAAHELDHVQEELVHAETNDELKAYFTQDVDPKIMLTTSYNSSIRTCQFAADIAKIFGGVVVYEERLHREENVRDLAISLIDQGYTSLIVVQENDHNPANLMLIALPYGPTAYFRLTNVFTRAELTGCVKPLEDAPPEVIMTNFKTRHGRRVGRLLQQCLSKKELLKARQVVTFHNQRDFIFFRAYRYIFDEVDGKAKVRMSEIGPEFTLKLRWIQVGIYNPQYEEYEFVQPPHEEATNRTLFFM
ncbi:U3_small nucleolar ribonucleoprotein protein IMP4 [Hexamita inflata]|uniref:Putative n=1 Tax=Hexamita inflata TaxID=28002 RepID=A0AA86PSU3_9EUKA|nr:U3 small nucleolar ribonucleoprotein protein IMP4 [Hexamita inflata]